MKFKIRSSIVTGIAILTVAWTVNVLHHDEDAAAAVAERFAELAFVKHDLAEGYATASEELRKHMSFDAFKDLVAKLHPASHPTAVQPSEFEPMPGQRAMNIFLVGRNGEEQFFYRIVVAGTSDSGYQVAALYRGNGPYPASKLRQKLR